MDKNNQKEKNKDKPIQDKEDEKLTDEELDKVSGGICPILPMYED